MPMVGSEREISCPNDWLICQFRFPGSVLLDLCGELSLVLDRLTHPNCAILVIVQVLTTFGFLATHSFHRELADRSVVDMITNINVLSFCPKTCLGI